MSTESFLYGCILGIGPRGPGMNRFYPLNRAVIEALPDEIQWPSALVTRACFTVPMPHERAPFYRYQMIHFGASIKALDEYWADWLTQFESLLRKLYWERAYVHMEAEQFGNYDYHWEADYEPMFLEPPEPVRNWKFTGGPREFP
jgi:hypothetical protein